MSYTEKILSLTRQLYPKGRAFKMPYFGALEKLHSALAVSEVQLYEDIIGTLNSALPDNDDFTADDATAWEIRLGMISNPDVPLEDRKLAIKRKMNFPGTVPARQSYLFLENQLSAAGFDVHVYENRFDDGMGGIETRNPLVVSGGEGAGQLQHGQRRHGQRQHGEYFADVVINSIDPDKDLNFMIGENLRSTFFIAGATVNDFADVDNERRAEFRQLILRTKPVQTVGFLLINYT